MGVEDREGALLLTPSDKANEKRTGEGHLPTVRRATIKLCVHVFIWGEQCQIVP